jgi:hypothetical protein
MIEYRKRLGCNHHAEVGLASGAYFPSRLLSDPHLPPKNYPILLYVYMPRLDCLSTSS